MDTVTVDKRVQEISAIYEISQAFDHVPIDALLKLITAKAAEVMDAQACSLMLRVRDNDELAIKASCGLSPEIIEETRVAYGQGIAGTVAKTGRPMLVNNVQDDPRLLGSNVLPRPEIVSSISVPLRDEEGKVMGVLSIRRTSPAAMFNEDDLKVFSVFASQAALAISNAQLYSSLKERVQELSMLYQAGRELSAAYSLVGAADALVRIAAGVKSGNSVMLLLWENRGDGWIQASQHVSKDFCKTIARTVDEKAITWMRGLRDSRKWLLASQRRRAPSVKLLADVLRTQFDWVNLVPLIAEDVVDGVLIVGNKKNGHMDRRQARLLYTVASQAAVVIKNARSYNEMRRISELAAIGGLAANIAHEIRNPLSSIKGAAQFLRNEHSDLPPIREFLDIIIDEVNVLNKITTEFLDYARPARLSLREVNINEVISRTLNLLQMDLIQQGINVEYKPTATLPTVMADDRQLDQVFRNIIINAQQAMPDGGRLSLSAKESSQGVTVTVQDTGIGIPEGNLSQIFQPFFSTKTKGTGIGLAVVWKIIENHDGRLSVSSEVGKGTEIRIHLPLRSGRGDAQVLGNGRSDPPEADLFRRAQGS